MEPDFDSFVLHSDWPTDKIVYIGNTANGKAVTVVNPGSLSISSGGDINRPDINIVTQPIPNPYGKACLARIRWSVDGGSTWQGTDSVMTIQYTYNITVSGSPAGSTLTPPMVRGYVNVGCDDDYIYFRVQSHYNSNPVAVAVTPTPFSQTFSGWSPISQTFLIEFALYEVD